MSDNEQLVGCIVKGIEEKKGEEIIGLDFTKLDNAVCDFFIICHANSKIHVNAVAESVEEVVKKEINVTALHKEGYENAQWILLDYTTVVVHIFQNEYRTFYDLENLWGDTNTIDRKKLLSFNRKKKLLNCN